MAHAYSPARWTLFIGPASHLKAECKSYRDLTAGVGLAAMYLRHACHSLHFAGQLAVAAAAGFTHAFIAWLVPFAAEEIGTELGPLVLEKRATGLWPEVRASYAYSPQKWKLWLDGLEHVRFSGGSYVNHGRFACWASGQFLVGAVCGVLHAFLPFLLPFVAEEVVVELGGLVRKRRMLRNAMPDGTFKNPDKLSDFLGEGYEKKFEAAAAAAAANRDVGAGGDTLLDRERIKVQLQAGQRPEFL